MRMFLVILLAIVAVGAAGAWALGEYGGNFLGTTTEFREPIVKEPELLAANDAVTQPATANDAPALQSATAPPEQNVAPQAAPAPDAEPPAAAPAPAPPAASPLTAENLDTPAPAVRSAAAPPPAAETTPAPAAPAAPPPAPPAAPSEPTVQAQSAPAAASAAPVAPAAARSIEDELKLRTLTYNRPPAKLALNRPIDVSLVINATDNPDAGKDALEGFPGTITEATVEASDTVKAQLTGVGFDIVSQTVEIQRLSGKTINRWQWRVTPTELGTRTLILEVIGYDAGSNAGLPLDSFRDEIVVEIQQIDQVINWAKGYQPLFGVLAAIAGALSALFAFLRFREEKKRNKG